MSELNLFFRYALRLLLIAGPVEFLLGRTLSRVLGMLPQGPVADAINAVATLGLRLLEPVYLLALVVLAVAALWPWLAPRAAQSGPLPWPRLLAPLIGLFVILSLVQTVLPPSVEFLVGFNLLAAALVVGGAGLFALTAQAKPTLRLAIGTLGLAFAGYYIYVLGEVVRAPGGDTTASGAGDLGIVAHFTGEALAILWTFALFWAVGPLAPRSEGRTRFSLPRLLVALIPGILLAVAPFFETWMQGVLARMSVGFALFLPPPVIALAAVAYVYALLTCWAPGAPQELGVPWLREMGAGLILLPVAGFDLLSNYQLVVAALTMLLLTGLVRPLSAAPVAPPVRRPQPAAEPPRPEPRRQGTPPPVA
jgi:hypothetical protein